MLNLNPDAEMKKASGPKIKRPTITVEMKKSLRLFRASLEVDQANLMDFYRTNFNQSQKIPRKSACLTSQPTSTQQDELLRDDIESPYEPEGKKTAEHFRRAITLVDKLDSSSHQSPKTNASLETTSVFKLPPPPEEELETDPTNIEKVQFAAADGTTHRIADLKITPERKEGYHSGKDPVVGKLLEALKFILNSEVVGSGSLRESWSRKQFAIY